MHYSKSTMRRNWSARFGLKPVLVGINNRNLKTLEVDLQVSLDLAIQMPLGILPISESGLSTPEDLARVAASGITTFLVGESLLRHENVQEATKTLLVDNPQELK